MSTFRLVLICLSLAPLRIVVVQDAPRLGRDPGVQAAFLPKAMAEKSAERSETTGTTTIIQTKFGPVEGVSEEDGLRIFRGIPFGAPPVGEHRWRPPQPPEAWTGVRSAHTFGPRCMQARVYSDIVSRSDGMSEDCLYLNVWTPDTSEGISLPVLAYIHGGGFLAGDGSEPRYDGAAIARKGVVVVTMNYRLGIFGFLAHPELSAESSYGASGNYGLLDQTAALRWIRDNIAGFGGHPGQVTIAGESAGSISVSAHMVSPPSRGLFDRAIGESGSVLGTLPPVILDEAEALGSRFSRSVGAESLAELRAMSPADLLEAASKPGVPRFPATIDGHVYTQKPAETFEAGEQALVPLLVGWNSEERSFRRLFGSRPPTSETYTEILKERYPDAADDLLDLYPGQTREQVVTSATDLAGDLFTGLSSWRWFELHRQTGSSPVYRYYYTHPRPGARSGAVHSAEIEYALGNLDLNPVYDWTDEDYAVSRTMTGYFVNFIKTGDPNGPGLPKWPPASSEPDGESLVMVIDVESGAVRDRWTDRYELLDRLQGD